MRPLKRRSLGALVLKAILGAVVTTVAAPASAQPSAERAAHAPLIAVVALNSQRVTVYSARGKMLEAPVSTGKPGYETPAGVYSILQKRRDHYSNLYNDAEMPFMQRLTWSGIALHAGDLPGYPASHGCIRMPYEFAAQLFETTKRGMRVVVARGDVSPVDIAHPALFKPGPVPSAPGEDRAPGPLHLSSAPGGGAPLDNAAAAPPLTRRAMAATKEAAAEVAARHVDEVRRAAARIEREAEAFEDALRSAESAKRRAAARIEEADLLAAHSAAFAQEMKDIKAKAQERLAAAQAQIDAVYAEGKAKIDAARAARAEVKAAEAARTAAQNEAVLAVGRPVSVFISRKTQRLYVRRAFQPLFESDVTIRRPGAPIGTTIFTAMSWTSDDAELRWTALSMHAHRARPRGGGPAPTDAAKAALERISIPQDAVDRINQLVVPGSSLIISDEAMSKETGEATDFVVLMGGEPQGGVARRRLSPYVARDDDDGPFLSGGGFNVFSWW
ncbi:MAG: L,D-transpeptidase family protein [Hyphomonadaceae bacterium]|nr:L,D-transpeptidase family protein [Hyphomonadaceae bacterium]